MPTQDEIFEALLDQSNPGKYSDCCGAPIIGEITGEGEDACGRCSQCKEMSGIATDEE